MTEKTIWPEWIDGKKRLPTIEDTSKDLNYKVWTAYRKNCIPQYTSYKDVNKKQYWAVITFRNSRPDIATPSECEARKKEQAWKPESVSLHKGENGIAFSVQGSYEAESKKEDLNPWIHGNEPEKEGWYEVTYKHRTGNYVTVDRFNLMEWQDEAVKEIIAYKYIKLSNTYQPPEPERELLCPFCKSNKVEIVNDPGRSGEDRFYFCCQNHSYDNNNYKLDEICGIILPTFKTKKEAIDFTYNIYDKLNK